MVAKKIKTKPVQSQFRLGLNYSSIEKFCTIFCFLICAYSSTSAQKQLATDSSKIKKVEVIHADLLTYKSDSLVKIRKLVGNVVLKHKDTEMYCDSTTMYLNDDFLDAQGNVQINKNDSVEIVSNRLRYSSDTKIAIFTKDVVLKEENSILETDSLKYNLDTDIGQFWGGGRYTNDSSVLTSQKGMYYQKKDEVYFSDDVVLIHPKYTILSDTLKFNTKTKIAYFVAPTKILDGESTIYCETGFYDTENDIAQFGDKTVLKQGKSSIAANNIDYNRNDKIGKATGNVVWRDSTENITIYSDYAEYHEEEDYIMATNNPLLVQVEGEDTLFLSADTLFSYSETITRTILIDTSFTIEDSIYNVTDTSYVADTIQILHGFHDVRMIRSSSGISGIADSIYYSELDSIFRFRGDPILWMDSSQFSADSVNVIFKNKKVHKAYLYKNAFIVNESVVGLYDQVKGTKITAFFREDTIRRAHIDGNAESIYYIKDDSSRYSGVNSAKSAKMTIQFDKNEIYSIVYVNRPEGIYTPMKLANTSTNLQGFAWHISKMPRDKFDVIRTEQQKQWFILTDVVESPAPLNPSKNLDKISRQRLDR